VYECFKKLHHECDRDALTFGSASRSKLRLVNSIDVKGDPVGVTLTIREEIVVYFFLYLGDPVRMANS
jgi:hypothetical protein